MIPRTCAQLPVRYLRCTASAGSTAPLARSASSSATPHCLLRGALNGHIRTHLDHSTHISPVDPGPNIAIMPFDLITGKFIPEKSNIWRDCCDGMYDWVKEQILEGCTLNDSDHCGDPPLILAAGGGHLSCVRLLLDEGANIEQRNVMKETALIRAAHNGHLSVVEFLLQSGADISATDLGDNTALHWAAMRGHVEIVRTLLAAGANRGVRNKQGVVPVELCQPQWSLSWRFTQAVLTEN